MVMGGGRKIVSRSQNFGQINKTPLKVKVTRTGMIEVQFSRGWNHAQFNVFFNNALNCFIDINETVCDMDRKLQCHTSCHAQTAQHQQLHVYIC